MDYPYLERLSRADCLALLPSAPVGRLAVPTSHFPTLDPVSFAVVEGELVVAVRPGSAGDAVASGEVVTFQADVLEHAAGRGWSVVVSGPVEELDADVLPLVEPRLGPWPVTADDRVLLIRSDRVSGRRVVTGPDESPVDEISVLLGAAPPPGTNPPGATRRAVTAAEALALLTEGGQRVGRLVVTAGGVPAVYPLNYAVDSDAIVFRTQAGTKLAAVTRSMVTFEVDAVDRTGQGWTVAVEGLAQEVLDADPEGLRSRTAALVPETWPGGDRPHVVRITPYRIHGTAFTPASAPAGTGSSDPPARRK